MLKVKVGHAHQKWLEDEENADKWFNMDEKFSAKERRILIVCWVGEAYEELLSSEYDHLRWRVFEKTGCLMTADGSDDNLITPEGLPDYQMPPPMTLLDPQDGVPVPQNVKGVEPMEVEETDQDPTEGELDTAEEEFKLDYEEDRVYERGGVGKKFKVLYDSGWFIGHVKYYNHALGEYKVDFDDGSVDYISPDDIDGIEVIELG